MTKSKADDSQRELFARSLSEAVAASGLSLDEIIDRLAAEGTRTSRATLSYWQNGRSAPRRGSSLTVVAGLERVLGLAQGALTSQLSKGSSPVWESPEAIVSPDALETLLQGWGLSMGRMHRHLMMQTTWHVSADRREAVEVSRAVTQVEAESQSAFPVAVADFPENPTPTIHAVHGCTIGRQTELIKGTAVAEMLLPAAMARGEVYWTELEYHLGRSVVPRHWLIFGLGSTVPVVTMDIIFEGRPPHRISHGQGDKYSPGVAVEVEQGSPTAQVVLNNPEPGLHWFEWTDEED